MTTVSSPGTPHHTDLTHETLTQIGEIAATLAREAGELIKTRRAEGVSVASTKSSVTDVVTAADREAEELLLRRLRELRPADGIVGEEGASVESTSGITWVLDPIDGTVNYLYGLPSYGVSVAATVADAQAAADGRRAVAGAVYLPVTNELFTAVEGGGSRLNDTALPGPAEVPLDRALLATGFGYTKARRVEQAGVIRQLIPQVRDIRRMGSAAADLCLLAAGRLDAYYERGLQPWDYAAGLLIARESGVHVYGRDADTPPGEPLLIAAAPSLAVELREAITHAYAALDESEIDEAP